ncbi:MAG: Gfo/Idh/MocA family oxidoreductase [Ignavibacteria bacterium]
MERYRVCIIGMGDIGFLFDHDRKGEGALTHYKAFNDSDNFEVTGVCEIRKETAEIISREYGTDVFENYEKMCEEKKPDIIVVAANDESHPGILYDLTKYKPALVFCEKPLALTLGEVRDIVSMYEQEGIPLQVNFTRRFLEEFYEIKKIIEENKIGGIESITFYYQRGLIHNASHYIDLVNWYIGETEKNIIRISTKEGITADDDTIGFDMIYENGLEIRFIGLSNSKLSFAEIDLVGTKGRIRLNYKNEIEKYRVTENKMFKGYSAYELYECQPIQYPKALPNAVKNIYDFLQGREKLRSPAANSIKIFELINRIKENKLCLN